MFTSLLKAPKAVFSWKNNLLKSVWMELNWSSNEVGFKLKWSWIETQMAFTWTLNGVELKFKWSWIEFQHGRNQKCLRPQTLTKFREKLFATFSCVDCWYLLKFDQWFNKGATLIQDLCFVFIAWFTNIYTFELLIVRHLVCKLKPVIFKKSVILKNY